MKLTFDEFRAEYDGSYEDWHGEAKARSSSTVLHGLAQAIVGRLLSDAGYLAGSSVELRIEPDARPIPDVIATGGSIEQPYPTRAVDVVVEIFSPDDAMPYVLESAERTRLGAFISFTLSIRRASNCFAGAARRLPLLSF